LRAFAREQGFDSSRWTLLYGQSADVLELAAVLGVNYKKTTPLDYAHSNIITVLNAMGDVVYQQEGLGTDPTATIEKIRELVNKSS
jgi:protein SCO1/2